MSFAPLPSVGAPRAASRLSAPPHQVTFRRDWRRGRLEEIERSPLFFRAHGRAHRRCPTVIALRSQEHQIMTDEEMLARADANYFSAMTTFIGQAERGDVRSRDGVLDAYSGTQVAAFNVACV